MWADPPRDHQTSAIGGCNRSANGLYGLSLRRDCATHHGVPDAMDLQTTALAPPAKIATRASGNREKLDQILRRVNPERANEIIADLDRKYPGR